MKFLVLLACSPFFVLAQNFEPLPVAGERVAHSYYTLSYVEAHEQPEWVYYILSEALVTGSEKRKDNFRVDPLVTTVSATLQDYAGCGYDRGHLAPAADMTLNQTSMSESFFMSNMSPQFPALNRGKWKNLEALVRGWTVNNGTLFVATGPIFEDALGTVGENKVTIPGYYYKVIYAMDEHKMIGFVMPNKKLSAPLASFATSVDEIEARTNIDFFYQLDDEAENCLESSLNTDDWSFVITKIQKKQATKDGKVSTQCLGIAKSTGNRCKNNSKYENGYCSRHQNQAQD